jgi:hypothetical protein
MIGDDEKKNFGQDLRSVTLLIRNHEVEDLW